MAGAKILIGTNLFLALKEGIERANKEFGSLSDLPEMETACAAWHLVTQIVHRFEELGRQSQSAAIDPAFNLIYLTTGVLYHHISTLFSVVPKHVQPYATVEPLDALITACLGQQSEQNTETESILTNLVGTLRRSLAELQ